MFSLFECLPISSFYSCSTIGQTRVISWFLEWELMVTFGNWSVGILWNSIWWNWQNGIDPMTEKHCNEFMFIRYALMGGCEREVHHLSHHLLITIVTKLSVIGQIWYYIFCPPLLMMLVMWLMCGALSFGFPFLPRLFGSIISRVWLCCCCCSWMFIR